MNPTDETPEQTEIDSMVTASRFLVNLSEATFIPLKEQDVKPRDVPDGEQYIPTSAELKSFRDRTSLPFRECRRVLTIARGDTNKAIALLHQERLDRHFSRPGATDIIFD